MGKSGRKRKRRRGGGGGRRGGVMVGMRGGFRNFAGSFTGSSRTRRRSWAGTAVTVALVAAAAYLLLNRL